MTHRCQGSCSKHGECRGEVTHVWSGNSRFTLQFPDWDWWYCEEAIKTDRANGFVVETDEEHEARLNEEAQSD